MTNYVGTAGNDSLAGGPSGDRFDISQGGRDRVDGGSGWDTIDGGAAVTSDDRLVGGAGLDLLNLNGDYSAGLRWDGTNFRGIENVYLGAGHSYDISIADLLDLDSEFPYLSIGASSLGEGDHLTVDASTVTSGILIVEMGMCQSVVTGGHMADSFDLTWGGSHLVHAGDGNDRVSINGAAATVYGEDGDDRFTIRDSFDDRLKLDGGAGMDSIVFQHGSSVGTLSGANLAGFERIEFEGFAVNNLTLLDSVATPDVAGGVFEISGEALFNTKLTVNASRETDTSMLFIAGDGDVDFTGGRMSDTFDLYRGATRVASGGQGDDVFLLNRIAEGDRLHGGAGVDTLHITDWDGFTAVFGAEFIDGIDRLIFDGRASVTLDDANVARGQLLTVDGSNLIFTSQSLNIDGSAETDGRLHLQGGKGSDTFVGGAGRDLLDGGDGADSLVGGASQDRLTGGAGADRLTGGAGGDMFIFMTLADSAGDRGNWDTITDLFDTDVINLRGIDARLDMDGDQSFRLVTAFSHKAGQAVLSYDKAINMTALSLDVDGDGVADGGVMIQGRHLDFTHFIL